MKTVILCLAGLFHLSTNDVLTGRWETKPSRKGNVTGVVFKADNSFEGYVNKKPFVSGKYILEDSIIKMVDNGCNQVWCTYKMHFTANGDTATFELIDDKCEERAHGMVQLVLGRVRPGNENKKVQAAMF